MSDVSIAAEPSVPRKRVFAPEPTAERTHLYEADGPMVWACLHKTSGMLVAFSGRQPHWSHAGVLPSSLRNHPDELRTVYVWMDETEARKAMIAVSSFEEFESLSFHRIRCDVAQSPLRGDYVNVDETPRMHVSIEACEAGPLQRFPRRAEHRLDPKMRRTRKARPGVSVARSASARHDA